MRPFVLLFVLLLLRGTEAALQTYAFKYRYCDVGELPRLGEAGDWTCYTACGATNDPYRTQPCRRDIALTGACPGFYRTTLFDSANSQGLFLTSRTVCIYPLVSSCAYSEQISLCGRTTAGCLRSDYFDAPQIRLNGTCTSPQLPLGTYGTHEYLPCTRDQLKQACYADERECAYDNYDSRLVFRCPWTPAGQSWGNNNTVPDGLVLQSTCTDQESETVCASDWRTRVPREPCTRRIVKYTEYTGHTYVYDTSLCNRRPCTAAEQLSYCGFYTSDCWLNCPTPTSCTLRQGACDASLRTPTPARFCTEAERIQTCVDRSAAVQECRVICTSTDLQSGCQLQSRCLATQGYPQHQWNVLSLLPNVSYVCTADEHAQYCNNRNKLDPFRQDQGSLCRKICGRTFHDGDTGVCALRDPGSCNRQSCNTNQQLQACAPGVFNTRCSALSACSNFTNASAPCGFEPYCPNATETYINTSAVATASYLSSFQSSQIVRECNSTEFSQSCAPFTSMCRARCNWTVSFAQQYDAATTPQKAAWDYSQCVLEHKCAVGQINWQPVVVAATTTVRACTTPELQSTCAEVPAQCKVVCPFGSPSSPLCNITAYCPWSFGFIAPPFRNPNAQLCTNAESIATCGNSYVSPCLKYNCTYFGYNQTYTNCAIDANSCNVRYCQPDEQRALCGYYTHSCQVKCTSGGQCALVNGTCGAYSDLPVRTCNATELLDSCAAYDLDCRVQCISTDLTWGCVLSNICPWTAGQWAYDQLETVPYTRGDSFSTAVFCGPGWISDSYSNPCEKYQCLNTRRLGRHNCECHYSTCYCPFRYTTQDYKCSQDASFVKACDAFDTSPSNHFSVLRNCGRFGRACALVCTGDKNAPSCQIAGGSCSCIDDTSFAPFNSLKCHGYAQACNSTEWEQCGLYASTCVAGTYNATSLRFVRPEARDLTCTCMAGIVTDTGDPLPCRSTRVTSSVYVRACTTNEVTTNCGPYGASCQVYTDTAAFLPGTCICNASSVTVYRLSNYTSRTRAQSKWCPGPSYIRDCTPGEVARCETPLASCLVNVTLGQPDRLVNRSACFPDRKNVSCPCDDSLARLTCGPGYVSCTVKASFNQVDGCYNATNSTATCVCHNAYANVSRRLGYTCTNATTLIRNCTSDENLRWCGPTNTVSGAAHCYAFDFTSTLVPGTCDAGLVRRVCNATERAQLCPKATNTSVCEVICTNTTGVCYGLQSNASCPPPLPAASLTSPTALLPPNSTGYPRECTDDEYSLECAHDMNCSTVLGACLEYVNITFNNSVNVTVADNTTILVEDPVQQLIFNLTYAEAVQQFGNNSNVTINAYNDPTSGNFSHYNMTFAAAYYRDYFNITTAVNPLNDTQRVCVNYSTAIQCSRVPRRVSLCVARSPSNYSCTCKPGFGPLNPRMSFATLGLMQVDPRDAKLGKCEGVVRDCDAGTETLLYGGTHAISCKISCNEADRTANCIIYNATCDPGSPSLPVIPRISALQFTANEVSAFYPVNIAQPCGQLGYTFFGRAANSTIVTIGSQSVNLTGELQRRCGPYVSTADFIVFDCNNTHSLCEPFVRYAVYTLACYCQPNTFAGDLLPCERDYYIRPCNRTEQALVPRDTFDAECQQSYACQRMCYPATATQPEVCFRHAPDPCLDTYRTKRWCNNASAKAVCGDRAISCYGRCRVQSDIRLTVDCDANNLDRCICDTFNTTFFTGVQGLPCDRDYTVLRLTARDDITRWCGILGESGTVRCRNVNDTSTCFAADACLCYYDAGQGEPIAYLGFQAGRGNSSNATETVLITNATLNTTIARRPLYSHCAYVYTVVSAAANSTSVTAVGNVTVSGSTRSIFKGHHLPRWKKLQDVSDPSDTTNNNGSIVLIDNRPVLINVPTQKLGFSCEFTEKCGVFTEASIIYCDSASMSCNVTCGCYEGATTMLDAITWTPTSIPCSGFRQICDLDQRQKCAERLGVDKVASCTAICDERNEACVPEIGTCLVDNTVAVPRYVECTEQEAAQHCGRGHTPDDCQLKRSCATTPPSPDCFVCTCRREAGYVYDPTRRYGHFCTDLQNEFIECSDAERNRCGLRGVAGCRKRLASGGYYADTLSRASFAFVPAWMQAIALARNRTGTANLASGMTGGLWIQECICLADLFNALSTDIFITSELDDTLTSNGTVVQSNLRCDVNITDYLVQKGACPLRTDTGLPCNGVGLCGGAPDCGLNDRACIPGDQQWPNTDAQAARATFITHAERWELAKTQRYVWLYSDPAQFESCQDAWCNGAPITGRIAPNAYPENILAQRNTAVTGDGFGVPAKCLSRTTFVDSYEECNCPVCYRRSIGFATTTVCFFHDIFWSKEACRRTCGVRPRSCVPYTMQQVQIAVCGRSGCEDPSIPEPFNYRGDSFDCQDIQGRTNYKPYLMEGLPTASVTTQTIKNGMSVTGGAFNVQDRLAATVARTVTWNNCMLRQRSAFAGYNCYENTGSIARVPRSTPEALFFVPGTDPSITSTTSAYNGRHNLLMQHYDNPDRPINCKPNEFFRMQYAHVCRDTAMFNVDELNSFLRVSQVCAALETIRIPCSTNYCGCGPYTRSCIVQGSCRCVSPNACFIACTYAFNRWSDCTYAQTTPSNARLRLAYNSSVSIVDGILRVSLAYQAIGPTETFRPPNRVALPLTYSSQPVLGQTINARAYANDPSKWISGCVSSRTQLSRAATWGTGALLASTQSQTNWCTSWTIDVLGSLKDPADKTTPQLEGQLYPQSSDSLYCYIAKPTDNMYMWHGINNEVFYPGDKTQFSAAPTRILQFAPIFDNLPNGCTRCLRNPWTGNEMFSGADCGIAKFDPSTQLGFIGIAPLYGTCTGPQQACVIPPDWTGRADCINGYFDFRTFECICDPGGWTNDDPFIPQGALARQTQPCKYNYCTNQAFGVTALNPVCSGRGTCLGSSGICRCDLHSTWAGRLCDIDSSRACLSPFNGLNCGGHGTCNVLLNGTSYCTCDVLGGAGGYWNGSFCEQPHTPDDLQCTTNGGIVKEHPTRHVPYCECPLDRGGQFCQYSRCPVANGKICNEQGVCTVDGTNAAGFPKMVCRQPLSDRVRCPSLDQQCLSTKPAPPVCKDNREYGGCACEQPIRALCTPPNDPQSPMCDATSDVTDQLSRCQIYTDLANGSTTFRCQCPNGRRGLWCETSICGDCNGQVCDVNTGVCRCETTSAIVRTGLFKGLNCEIDVTDRCGYQVPSGEWFMCAGRGDCVLYDGQWSCLCQPGYTGAVCQLGDCVPPCDERGKCILPTPSATQKQCICNHPTVYGNNATFPNLCNVDKCKQTNVLTRPNANGTACECIDPFYSFASGCVTPICDTDPDSGQVCGPAHVSDPVQGACRVPYDYVFFPDSYARTGTTRRNKECDRTEKRCFEGSCLCGLGYRQNNVTHLCERICDPAHTTAIVNCLGTEADGCIRASTSLVSQSFTTFRCQCDPAYAGSLYCDTLRCMHGGVSSEDGKRCVCPFPWTGDTCTDDLCINGVANFVNNTCDCLFGWTGTRCEQTACKNGGVPNYNTLSCRCPTQWGGPSCETLTCRFNSYWNQVTQRCECPPGYSGERCDEPVCGNNVVPDANGKCNCNENYMDDLCLYRWCGPYGSVIPGTRICICRPNTGAVLDPISGNCTLPVCGVHSSWNIDAQECICDSGYTKNTSEPLQPCVHFDCGPHGQFNSYAGGCVCDSNWIGAKCDLDVVAFLQPVITQPIVLPNGVVVNPTNIITNDPNLLEGAPGAIVQVVLRDPYPLPISYEEEAVRAITQNIPGYTVLWQDLDDLVQDHGGSPTSLDPTRIPVVETVDVTLGAFDNTLDTKAYITSIGLITAIGLLGTSIFYSVYTSVRQAIALMRQ